MHLLHEQIKIYYIFIYKGGLLLILYICFLVTCRRSTEISLVIRQTMEACILTHLMPRSQVQPHYFMGIFLHELVQYLSLKPCLFNLQIDIFVQVLQADGGNSKLKLGVPIQCELLDDCRVPFYLAFVFT